MLASNTNNTNRAHNTKHKSTNTEIQRFKKEQNGTKKKKSVQPCSAMKLPFQKRVFWVCACKYKHLYSPKIYFEENGDFLVELQYFKWLGNSFHNFGPLYLIDFRPIVVLQLSIYRLFLPQVLMAIKGVITGRAAHAGIAFTQFSKNWFFAPQGRHITPIKMKFSMAEWTAVPLPRAKFHLYRGRNVGIQPPKLSNFRILAINMPVRDNSFVQCSRHFQHLYASLGRF